MQASFKYALTMLISIRRDKVFPTCFYLDSSMSFISLGLERGDKLQMESVWLTRMLGEDYIIVEDLNDLLEHEEVEVEEHDCVLNLSEGCLLLDFLFALLEVRLPRQMIDEVDLEIGEHYDIIIVLQNPFHESIHLPEHRNSLFSTLLNFFLPLSLLISALPNSITELLRLGLCHLFK